MKDWIKIISIIIQMSDNSGPKCCGRRRSIVRQIGSFLPLKPPPKIYVSVTALHSMTNSMIDQETSQEPNVNGFGSTACLSGSRPDLLEPISFGSEVRLLALEQELQELRDQVSQIVKNNKTAKEKVPQPERNGESTIPPPPMLPSPTTPHIARRASLQDHMYEDKRKNLVTQKSVGDMLQNINEVKLKPVERSPGGRPLQVKRDNSPCNDLQDILKRRYMAMQTPDSQNSSSANVTLDDSF